MDIRLRRRSRDIHINIHIRNIRRSNIPVIPDIRPVLGMGMGTDMDTARRSRSRSRSRSHSRPHRCRRRSRGRRRPSAPPRRRP
jgi:hypothetical protein